ncbi:Non-catalytic module family EXPN protein [Heterobasidion irregulare TC 32-1]|uniref:Non-catalytic module family EXPN protein n=1 Tax=Heterobasidion irregulare (strain TC 32-1) TaxID=747525 RepID=W4JMJ8_HETIT|nr:Non-catalytic module family EXPN protein [Heterobasidion irregulare TC 32-1]ETW74699.1 Non-catalytic module family EXPN protein [Heterobasidion irregulare TC 32-1]
MRLLVQLFALATLFTMTAAQNHTGTLFTFDPGLGACGFTNTSDQSVASVSQTFFSAFPGATENPNDNPICTHTLTITFHNTSVTAQIVDVCPGCPDFNVGLSPSAFTKFAPISQGIVNNVTWVVN